MTDEIKVTGTGTYAEVMARAAQPQSENQTEGSQAAAEPAGPEPAGGQAEPSSQSPSNEPVDNQQAEPAQQQAVPAQVNWEEVLTNNGFDSKHVELLKYIKEHGNALPYLEAKSKNYAEMSHEEIMRHDLRGQFKDVTDEEFEILYQTRIVDRYKLDRESYSETDPEARVGKIELKIAAEEARKRLIEEQEKFYIPDAKSAQQQQAQAAAEQQAQEELQQFMSYVQSHPETQRLLADKRLVIGTGNEAFNFAVSPEKLLEQVNDPQKFWQKFQTPQGLDMQKLYRAIAIADNIEGFLKSYAEHFKALATKDIVEGELQNVQPGGATKPAETNEDIWQAFKNKGTHKTFGG